MRKWRYFYVNGLFSSGTHIVIKNNDQDEFNIEEVAQLNKFLTHMCICMCVLTACASHSSLPPQVAQQGFLYAHGDTRTYTRLRTNIQMGRPVVMLHNSGGCVTAFSWLQRVMAFQRPPPQASELRGPLRFLIANLSEANCATAAG